MGWRWLSIWAGLIGSAAVAQEGAPPANHERVEVGEQVYQRHCAACHGPEGEGAPNWQTRNEQGELPPPPHGPTGHTWRHADAVLYRMISKGWRDPFNKTSRLTMPAYEGILTKEEIEAVIAFLKTLWTPEQRQFQAQESRRRSGQPSE